MGTRGVWIGMLFFFFFVSAGTTARGAVPFYGNPKETPSVPDPQPRQQAPDPAPAPAPAAQPSADAAGAAPGPWAWSVVVAAGAKTLWFDQTGIAKISAGGVVGKLSLEVAVGSSDSWVLWGDAFYMTGAAASQMSGNARVGYVVTNERAPVQLAVAVGGHYQHLKTTVKGAGYNIFGGMFFPVLSMNVGRASRLSLFPWYSNYSGSPTSISLKQDRELGVQLVWATRVLTNKVLMIGAEATNLSLSSEQGGRALTVGYTGTVGLGF